MRRSTNSKADSPTCCQRRNAGEASVKCRISRTYALAEPLTGYVKDAWCVELGPIRPWGDTESNLRRIEGSSEGSASSPRGGGVYPGSHEDLAATGAGAAAPPRVRPTRRALARLAPLPAGSTPSARPCIHDLASSSRRVRGRSRAAVENTARPAANSTRVGLSPAASRSRPVASRPNGTTVRFVACRVERRGRASPAGYAPAARCCAGGRARRGRCRGRRARAAAR